jgi:UDP-glucose 4-epimerase
MALEFINSNQSEVFNLGNGVGYSVKEIVKKVEELLNVSIPEEHTEPRQGEYAKIYANPEKAKNILNFETKVTLDQSINSLKNWYTKYPNGYEY